MRLSVEEEDEESQIEQEPLRDLMCGVGSKHIRLLCDNPWDGGKGVNPTTVGDMTLDQIFMMLCDKNRLGSGRNRVVTMDSLEATSIAKDGTIRGRAADGTPIVGRIGGKSLAKRLAEAAAQKRAEAPKKQRRRRRRD